MKQHKSLKTAYFHILLALSESDLHGFGIQRAVAQHSSGRTNLWPATLYGSLEELVNVGWIEELINTTGRPQVSEKRRYYRITSNGTAALSAEADRIGALAALAKARIASSHGGEA